MVHIDAHTNTMDSLYGSKFFHGTPCASEAVTVKDELIWRVHE